MAQQVSDSMQFHDSELAAAVAELSQQQRAVVVLHYLDDMSVIEVSAALSLSDGAVKYHLHQARERLRDILRPADSDDHYREGAP
jgi:RNA polymerase sigma-70 factor (ECF subfamily)